ncbi:helix-turn-helix domain-containing protein [Thiomicrorhabdus sp. Kp2]|uniref:helix-turn-helix domain-containing protein n=1 Tax=Thiomicrorhabdus sp. Kp2 TaxID=1123518 RepID=UPI0005925092|nr:helix-turn-helix domain-containing protein [Thiomicrorhabdus sp. Kp2]
MSKYNREFKLAIAKQCLSHESSLSISKRLGIPDRYIRYWTQVYRFHGQNAFIKRNTPYSFEDKYRILKHMRENNWSISYTSIVHNMSSPGTISTWLTQFERFGLSGLQPKKQGRKMKKNQKQETIKPTEQMSLEELREELEYRRAENAYLKKLDALLQEKERQTKKKQGS